jgi:hypothetical protein
VEFGVVIGEYRGVVRVPRRVFQRLLPERPTPRAAARRRSMCSGSGIATSSGERKRHSVGAVVVGKGSRRFQRA